MTEQVCQIFTLNWGTTSEKLEKKLGGNFLPHPVQLTQNWSRFGRLIQPQAWKWNGFILDEVDKPGNKWVKK